MFISAPPVIARTTIEHRKSRRVDPIGKAVTPKKVGAQAESLFRMILLTRSPPVKCTLLRPNY